MWNLILVCLEIVLVSVKDRCMVCAKHIIGSENRFEHTRWYSLVARLRCKRFNPFGEVVILTQDRCTVCAKYTKGS
jgi:hypothetical protein